MSQFSHPAPILSELNKHALFEIAQSCVTVGKDKHGANAPVGSKLVDTNDFADHTKVTVTMKINGSLEGYEGGTDSPVWRPDPENMHIFQQIDSMVDGKIVYKGDETKTLMLDMTIDEVQSHAPVPIGVNYPNVVPREAGPNGKMYAHVILPNSTFAPGKVIRSRANVTRDELAIAGSIDAKTLLKGTFVQDGVNDGKRLVPIDSNMTRFLAVHGNKINVDIAQVYDSGYPCYNLEAEAIGDAIALANKIQNIPLDNMRNFQATFERADAHSWTEKEGVCDNGNSQRMTNKYPVFVKASFSLQHTE